MKINVLIYSTDTYFIQAISTFIRNYKEITIIAFSDEAQTNSYIESSEQSIHIILAPEKFLINLPQNVSALKLKIADQTEVFEKDGLYSLNIYQPGEDIVRDLKRIFADVHTIASTRTTDRATKCAAFFSTQGGSGTSTVAYMTAIQLSKSSRVLYMNFELTPYINGMQESNYSVAMQEVLFHLKDRRNVASILLKAAVKNEHGLFTLPPFSSVGDLLELQEDEINYLLEQITASGEYDVIVVDLPAYLSALSRTVLQECDNIFMVYTATNTGIGKSELWRQDPYVQSLGLVEKSHLILNKCESRNISHQAVAYFPISQSMLREQAIDAVLASNLEFAEGCQGIVNELFGEG